MSKKTTEKQAKCKQSALSVKAKTVLSILKGTFSNPLGTTIIDRSTGRIIREEHRKAS